MFRINDVEDGPFSQHPVRELARLRGYRSLLFVPLLRDQKPIGAISVTRVAPGPFADHHVQMLQTFADQAAIAISNVELFRKVQASHQRTIAIPRRSPHRAGSPGADREAGLARPAHRWHRARDQEPAQFRQ